MREYVKENDLRAMLRNDKKSQQTHLVATMVAKMPNGLAYTETGKAYGTVLIPKGSIVGNVYAVTTEAFDAGATFDVGIEGDTKCFFDAFAGNEVKPLADSKEVKKYLAKDTEVIITPTYAGDNEVGTVQFVFELYELEASIGRYTR